MSQDTTPTQTAFRAALLGAISNLSLALIKAAGGILGHSAALIADAVESATDVISSLVILSGIKISEIPPDRDHPYGHGKAEPLAAMVVSAFIIAAGLSVLAKNIHELLHPVNKPVPAFFAVIILVFVVIVKEGLFRFVIKEGADIDSLALKNDAWHHRSDAITSAAALLGVGISTLGGESFKTADTWAALLAGVVILANGGILFYQSTREIMDAAPPSLPRKEIIRTAEEVSGVLGIEQCLVRKMGLEYFIDLHAIVDATISVKAGHDIAHHLKAHLRQHFPSVRDVLVHIEPNICELKIKTHDNSAARKKTGPLKDRTRNLKDTP